MSGLRPPPSHDAPSRVLGRMTFLVVLLIFLAAVIWAAVTIQQIPLVENVPLSEVETGNAEKVDGITLNVVDEGSASPPVFLFHDADISGSVALEDLMTALGDDVHKVAVDLPGFGLSTRLPSEGAGHTVAGMARTMVEVIESRSDGEALLVGVGLGGEVAAEVAATRSDLVSGLVMVDVDFYNDAGLIRALEGIPWFGLAVTQAAEINGSIGQSSWDPYCGSEGWCPTEGQERARQIRSKIVNTTDSLYSFRNTSPASDVPARLGDITAPSILVWSTMGSVPEDSINRVETAMQQVSVQKVDTFQAHLDDPALVAALIKSLFP